MVPSLEGQLCVVIRKSRKKKKVRTKDMTGSCSKERIRDGRGRGSEDREIIRWREFEDEELPKDETRDAHLGWNFGKTSACRTK